MSTTVSLNGESVSFTIQLTISVNASAWGKAPSYGEVEDWLLAVLSQSAATKAGAISGVRVMK